MEEEDLFWEEGKVNKHLQGTSSFLKSFLKCLLFASSMDSFNTRFPETDQIRQVLVLLSGLLERLGVKRYAPDIFLSSSNGQCERVNQCLESYLRCMCFNAWIKWLALSEYWYNTNSHTSLKCTPGTLWCPTEAPSVSSLAGATLISTI